MSEELVIKLTGNPEDDVVAALEVVRETFGEQIEAAGASRELVSVIDTLTEHAVLRQSWPPAKGDDEEHECNLDVSFWCTDAGTPYTEAMDFLEQLGKVGVWAKLEARVGPGGGNPNFSLKGPYGPMREWVRETYCGGLAGWPDEEKLEKEVDFLLWGDPPWADDGDVLPGFESLVEPEPEGEE